MLVLAVQPAARRAWPDDPGAQGDRMNAAGKRRLRRLRLIGERVDDARRRWASETPARAELARLLLSVIANDTSTPRGIGDDD